MSRDFLLLVFFMNQIPPSPRVFQLDRFEFFRKFAEIFASQGAPPVSTTPMANLPPVSKTPVAKLPPVSTTPVAGFRQLKVNLKAKIYIHVNSSIQRCPNKIIKHFLILKIFFICHLCQLQIFPRIFEKI